MPLQAGIVTVTPLQQNCTLLWDDATKRGAVVDPGGDLDRIEAGIAKVGMTVEKILLTHGHIDHAAGAAELKSKLGGIPIEGPHEEDKFLLDSLVESGLAFGMTDARNVTPDRWLNEGDIVTVADATFSILHCPGHSPGSVAYVNAEQRFALVGDVLFRGSIGRTEGLPRTSHSALIQSIKTKLLPLGDEYAFVCGHGPSSTIGQERRTNPFLV
ncbi:MAG TPA: MBL fold metallo-hydrolase [Hyphomicrobiaceae bacterium]|jgi:glyoxylase-like metal-dependent hydrolase (beta-lactamase superfamily II)|nr:MBL fold metallo-hydrolase [Hyphomicrobiaceae bacterium]